jgi:hypothetical protein
MAETVAIVTAADLSRHVTEVVSTILFVMLSDKAGFQATAASRDVFTECCLLVGVMLLSE